MGGAPTPRNGTIGFDPQTHVNYNQHTKAEGGMVSRRLPFKFVGPNNKASPETDTWERT